MQGSSILPSSSLRSTIKRTVQLPPPALVVALYFSATYFENGLPLQTHEVVAKVGVNALSNTLAIEMAC
jgi:hypothetical protein